MDQCHIVDIIHRTQGGHEDVDIITVDIMDIQTMLCHNTIQYTVHHIVIIGNIPTIIIRVHPMMSMVAECDLLRTIMDDPGEHHPEGDDHIIIRVVLREEEHSVHHHDIHSKE